MCKTIVSEFKNYHRNACTKDTCNCSMKPGSNTWSFPTKEWNRQGSEGDVAMPGDRQREEGLGVCGLPAWDKEAGIYNVTGVPGIGAGFLGTRHASGSLVQCLQGRHQEIPAGIRGNQKRWRGMAMACLLFNTYIKAMEEIEKMINEAVYERVNQTFDNAKKQAAADCGKKGQRRFQISWWCARMALSPWRSGFQARQSLRSLLIFLHNESSPVLGAGLFTFMELQAIDVMIAHEIHILFDVVIRFSFAVSFLRSLYYWYEAGFIIARYHMFVSMPVSLPGMHKKGVLMQGRLLGCYDFLRVEMNKRMDAMIVAKPISLNGMVPMEPASGNW